jgi:hypothetical protein
LKSRSSGKTVGADGQPTLSGWSLPRPIGLAYASPEAARAYAAGIGFTFEPQPPYYQIRDQLHRPDGWPGKFNASHAEIQQHLLGPGTPIGVTMAMCDSCVSFFQRAAAFENQTLVVADPATVRIFLPQPEGVMILIHPNGTTIRVAPDNSRYLMQADGSEVQIP